jgi:tetratricopeptide (TPR) repeat protein
MADASSDNVVVLVAQGARQGRFGEAAAIAETAVATGNSDPVLHALAGAIELRLGRFDRAVDYLNHAHTVCPADIAVRTNLIESLYKGGRQNAALAMCDVQSALADRSLRIARLGGHLAQEAGDFELAHRLYRVVVEREPKDWSVWNNLGNSLTAIGDYAEAASALAKAAELVPDSPPVQLNYGNALIDADRPEDGENVLRAAAKRFVDDPAPLLALFTIFSAMGREDEAFEAIRDAASRAPQSANIQSDLGQEAARRNLYEEAEAAFERALALQPDLGPAFVGLASVFERMNREQELDPLHACALANCVDPESLAYIEALQLKRANLLKEAFEALERAGDVIVPGRRLHLKGTMLDRLGRHDEAFGAFEEMNEFWRADPSQPQARAKAYREEIALSNKMLTPEWVASWPPAHRSFDLPDPIFLVGFPRSGTTLLDTMLMSDPVVRVLEEEPFLSLAEHELGGIQLLPELSDDAVAEARRRYFERVATLVDVNAQTIIIDKHPMHLTKVAISRRLFPNARFVLALRHPCDVLLSCFITNFRINNAMANFLDLRDAADLYNLALQSWENARDCFGLNVSTVVYERLVEDTERELAPLFRALDLRVPQGVFDHRDAARSRGTVRTASYWQVTEPIYKRAAGRWKHYSKHLGPIFPIIAPWVERFGYSLDDDRIPDWPSEVSKQ